MELSKVLVTGGAGFMGSHVVDALIERGYEVVVIDNLSAGSLSFLKEHFGNKRFRFHRADLLNDPLRNFFEGCDAVWHLAANPEVRIGAENPKIHIEQNVLATHKVLEEMRKAGIKTLVFTSTSTIYGEAEQIPTPENYGPLLPISLYGASKLACEAIISAYCHTFGMNAVIYRFANVVGKRLRHGVIYDFIMKLKRNPNELEILGDGTQTKSYIYIDDCINAMFFGLNAISQHEKHKNEAKEGSGKSESERNYEDKMDECEEEGITRIFNIGTEDAVSVRRIAEIVCEELGLKPRFKFTGGKRGWKGDVRTMLLDASALRSLGWHPKFKSEEAVRRATQDLIAEIWKR